MSQLNILLLGASGCGKTSLLNIIIREYYGFTDDNAEYRRDVTCNNILYINSLKEQGINFYRNEVKNFCQIPSYVPDKKKLIVIDDMDILNDQSQQVFRNCMDKHANNLCIIASTNNMQKVIDSIQSRMFIIKMDVLTDQQLLTIMREIKRTEGLDFSDDLDEKLIRLCNNSCRIIINYLEKIKLYGKPITEENYRELCSHISFIEFEEYTDKWVNRDLAGAIAIINGLFDKGYSVIDILENYFYFIKMVDSIDEMRKFRIIKTLCYYINIFHSNHEHEIELTMLTYDLYADCENDNEELC